MDNSLVFIEPNRLDAEPFTTSRVVADTTGIEHRKIKSAIRKYQKEIDTFGLSASYQAESSGGRPEEIVRLNEQQATFLMTLLKNTPVVVEFKKELVRQFYEMRTELLNRKDRRADLKPIRRELTDVVKEADGGRWAYKQYTDLAYKTTLGLNAAQLRKERNAPKKAVAIDYMTAAEIEAVTKRQAQFAVLLEMGLDYQEIKALALSSVSARRSTR